MDIQLTEEQLSLVDELDAKLNTHNDPIVKNFIKLTLEHICIFAKKQHDYGPRNISDFREQGVLVRCNDKMARLKNLMVKDQDKAVKEMNEILQRIVHHVKDPGFSEVEYCMLPNADYEWIAEKARRGIKSNPSCESLLDTWQDLSIYGQIAEMLIRGMWDAR